MAKFADRVRAHRIHDVDDIPTIPGFSDIQLLGHGGMGQVYSAVQDGLGRQVAIKVMRDLFTGDEQASRRFSAEARSLAKLEHPNIVTIHSVGTFNWSSSEVPYIVMQLVDGVNLREFLPNVVGMPEQISTLMQTLCNALEHAHEAGVIHRDIKPENILIDSKGQIRLTDFGIARDITTETITATGGKSPHTPIYAAPEVQAGRKGTVLADVYSCGALLLELVTGKRPDPELSELEQLPECDWKTVVQKATAFDWNNRYASISEFNEAVKQCGSIPKPAKPKPEATPDTERLIDTNAGSVTLPAARQAKFLVWGAVCTLLITTAGLAFYFYPTGAAATALDPEAAIKSVPVNEHDAPTKNSTNESKEPPPTILNNTTTSLPAGVVRFTSIASGDGTLEGRSGTYGNARSAPAGVVHQDWIQAGHQWHTLSNQFYVWRAQLTFDTSSLPDLATITSATLKIKGFKKHDVTYINPVLHVVPLSIGSGTVVQPEDFFVAYGENSLGSVSFSDFSTKDYNMLVLNETGLQQIDPTGFTTLGLRMDLEISDTAPSRSGNNYYSFFARCAESTGEEPILEITYEVPH